MEQVRVVGFLEHMELLACLSVRSMCAMAAFAVEN